MDTILMYTELKVIIRLKIVRHRSFQSTQTLAFGKSLDSEQSRDITFTTFAS